MPENLYLVWKTQVMFNIFKKDKRETEIATKQYGENVSLNETTVMDFVSIGNNCYLYKCHLDSYSYLSSSVSMMNTTIGKFCSIAQGTCIALGTHPSHTFVSTSPVFFSIHKQCGTTFSDRPYFEEMIKTTIGNDVWIGVNAIIKDGLVIGDGAIVGAGAIVTKDVPPYAIVVGNPARILRYRFTEEEISFLLDFKWWDKDPAWLRDNFKLLHNIKEFIATFK